MSSDAINQRLERIEQQLNNLEKMLRPTLAEMRTRKEIKRPHVVLELACKTPYFELSSHWSDLMKDERFVNLTKTLGYEKSDNQELNFKAERFWNWMRRNDNQRQYWAFYNVLWDNPSLRLLLPDDIYEFIENERCETN